MTPPHRSRSRRICRWIWRSLLVIVVLLLLAVGCLWWYFHPDATTTRGITYGQRNGHTLQFDVVRPRHATGIGVLVMISGSWKSDPAKFQPWMAALFLRQGHTVFAISHLSQPEASVMEIVADVQRATRFIRLHAEDYGIDPQRLAVTGGSSGGHLSLMLATRGGPGNPAATDPVERESSAVEAAAVFFPVTDLLNLGPSTQNLHDGGPPKSFRNAFGPRGTDLAEWPIIGRSVSPIHHITEGLPPVFIVHGDADTLVPLDQSVRFRQRAAELGHDVHLIIREGKKHGWLTMIWDAHLFADWFTEKLPRSSLARLSAHSTLQQRPPLRRHLLQ
ncbi:MAG TPA: alpha/beta hydrolase [Prosthecobacter sp.]|nr:alpha/beta hydrolase [Prosthecobacter sp.]